MNDSDLPDEAADDCVLLTRRSLEDIAKKISVDRKKPSAGFRGQPLDDGHFSPAGVHSCNSRSDSRDHFLRDHPSCQRNDNSDDGLSVDAQRHCASAKNVASFAHDVTNDR
jgi:hypothetical protein